MFSIIYNPQYTANNQGELVYCSPEGGSDWIQVNDWASSHDHGSGTWPYCFRETNQCIDSWHVWKMALGSGKMVKLYSLGITYPFSHNHGSVENWASKRRETQIGDTPILHWTVILGGRQLLKPTRIYHFFPGLPWCQRIPKTKNLSKLLNNLSSAKIAIHCDVFGLQIVSQLSHKKKLLLSTILVG